MWDNDNSLVNSIRLLDISNEPMLREMKNAHANNDHFTHLSRQ